MTELDSNEPQAKEFLAKWHTKSNLCEVRRRVLERMASAKQWSHADDSKTASARYFLMAVETIKLGVLNNCNLYRNEWGFWKVTIYLDGGETAVSAYGSGTEEFVVVEIAKQGSDPVLRLGNCRDASLAMQFLSGEAE